jgi:hypothetical protein
VKGKKNKRWISPTRNRNSLRAIFESVSIRVQALIMSADSPLPCNVRKLDLEQGPTRNFPVMEVISHPSQRSSPVYRIWPVHTCGQVGIRLQQQFNNRIKGSNCVTWFNSGLTIINKALLAYSASMKSWPSGCLNYHHCTRKPFKQSNTGSECANRRYSFGRINEHEQGLTVTDSPVEELDR